MESILRHRGLTPGFINVGFVLMVATRRAPERAHFPALDGCRGVAALAVLVLHVALLSGYASRTENGIGAFLARGDVGVSVFFVLSGFLLYRPFVVARLAQRSSGDLGTYALRRILRIFPAYWVALLVVGYVMDAPAFADPHRLWSHFFLLHIYDNAQLVGGPIQQSWTLATELSFYAFLPVYAWVLARVRRSPRLQLRAEVTGVAALWLGSTTLKVVTIALGADQAQFGQLSTWLPYRLDEFALGMALAVASAWLAARDVPSPDWLAATRTAWASWAVAGLLFVLLCTAIDLPTFPLFTPRESFVVRFVYSFCALCFVAPAVFAPPRTGPVNRLLANRLLLWLGLVSYGIYIWHEAVQDLYLRWSDQPVFGTSVVEMGVATLLGTIPLAALSYYVIERPCIRFGHRRRTTHLDTTHTNPEPSVVP